MLLCSSASLCATMFPGIYRHERASAAFCRGCVAAAATPARRAGDPVPLVVLADAGNPGPALGARSAVLARLPGAAVRARPAVAARGATARRCIATDLGRT